MHNALLPAQRRSHWAEFLLYTTARKKSIGKLHKKSCLKSPKIVQLFSKKFLTSGADGDIIATEVKGKQFLKRRKATVKKFSKNFKKALDKLSKTCYNESTNKRYQTFKGLKRNSKNLLTNRRKYDIIKSQKDKDSPKNQKGFEYGKDYSYH